MRSEPSSHTDRTQTDRTYTEKRGYIRMRLEAPIAIRCGEQELDAICRNLSGSGLLVEAERELPLQAAVEVFIDQEGDNRVPFRAAARVLRVQPSADGRFAIGLEISHIHD